MFSGRMLDKTNEPTIEAIATQLGPKAQKNLDSFEKELLKKYDLKKELRFPFGNNYGWGYKYSHKNKHLCYLFFEEGGFTIMLQLGDGGKVEACKNQLSPYALDLWANRYPCGKKGGGWIDLVIILKN